VEFLEFSLKQMLVFYIVCITLSKIMCILLQCIGGWYAAVIQHQWSQAADRPLSSKSRQTWCKYAKMNIKLNWC